ncbi:MAG: sigma-E processing peptidase SpoIIGA [Bacillota bacterium]|jgi:stage II sporulation protein GA (sporulation sigma-E factor processing peptidase)
MVRYVYIDVLFLTNFVVNYLILLAAGRLAGRHVLRWRLALAAVAGAAYAASALVIPLTAAYSLPARLAFGFFMVALSYPEARGAALVTVTVSFFLCSAITAGTALALQAYSVRFLTAGSMFSPEPLVQWWVIAASLVILSAFPVLARLGGYRAGKPLPLMALELEVGGKKLGLTGLVDTGNNLRDPVSGLPVIVIDWEALQSVMPGEVFAFFLSTWDSVPASLPETPIGRRLRLIPYESLSGKKGVLPGFRPDWLALVEKDGVKVFKNAIVCASGERLCPSGLYQALLHPDLVNS